MSFKTVSVLSSVFILALTVDYKTFAESELNGQDVKDSCQDKEQLSIQNQNNFSEVVVNGTLNDEIKDADKNQSKLAVEGVYSKDNISASDITKNNSSDVNSTFPVTCILNKTVDSIVEIVNTTKLAVLLQMEPNVTNRHVPGSCVVVLFYSPSCPFSCTAAPHFNALQRFFPTLKMVAVDAMKNRNFNAQFGVFGTPTIMLFHGGRPTAKFNETSEYGLDIFAKFITKHTEVEPTGTLVVTSADFDGPISSIPVVETDYYLILSWIVIMARVLYSFYYSTWGRSLVDATLNAWREAEAQHHHVD